MNKTEFIQTKSQNMCDRLVNDHSAIHSRVDLLRSQLDEYNVTKYMSHLSTNEEIDRISHMIRSMIGSDEGSLAVITNYLWCFKGIMSQ